MILETIPNPILRIIATDLVCDDNTGRLGEHMLQTMIQLKGIGLAGPQIGIPERIFIAGEIIFANPKVDPPKNRTSIELEGCLSIPNIFGRVERPSSIRFEAMCWEGKWKKRIFSYSGMMSRIVQHEIDHLNGILFIDKIIDEDKKEVEDKVQRFLSAI